MNNSDHPKVVSLTESASAKIRDYLEHSGRASAVVRIALARSDCMGGRGFEYSFSLEDTPRPADSLVEENGLKIAIDSSNAALLKGSVIDYEESLQESGLKVTNPNAIAKCPCGDHDVFR